MYTKEVSQEFSIAIVEVVPIGGSDPKGVKNNSLNAEGLPTSDYRQFPRVLHIFEQNSTLNKVGADGSARLVFNGMPATIIKLREGAPYLAYTEHPSSRGACYLPRFHGIDDGAFGSAKDETIPSAITTKA